MKTADVAAEIAPLELTHCDGCGEPLPEAREPVSTEATHVSARCRGCGHLSVRTREERRRTRRTRRS